MLAIEPPIVPLFLTCGSPIPSAKTARDDIHFPTSFDEPTSACVVVAPTFKDLLETLIPDSPLIFLILIRSEYAANLNLIAGKRDIPPAKNVALPLAIFAASLLLAADLKKGELIESVEFEIPEKSAYVKYPNPASRYAIVGVYVAKFKNEVRVAVTGAGNSGVFRSKELETSLSSNFSPSTIDNVNISNKELNSDIHASAEYRAHLIKVMTKKAVSSC